MGAVVNEEAFCLKWNDFHTSLTSTFTELRAESDLLDATIFCEGKEIRGAMFCHLAVLTYLCGEVSKKGHQGKAKLLQLNRTQFPSLGIFVSKKVGNQKN